MPVPDSVASTSDVLIATASPLAKQLASSIRSLATARVEKATSEVVTASSSPFNLIVEATAGSGKTTLALAAINNLFGDIQGKGNLTPQQLAVVEWVERAWQSVPPEYRSPYRVNFLAFNKSIADELSARLTNGEASTIHSFGMKLLNKHLATLVGCRSSAVKRNTWKTVNLFCTWRGVRDMADLSKESRVLLDCVQELVSACKDFVLTEHHFRNDSRCGIHSISSLPHPIFGKESGEELLYAVAAAREITIEDGLDECEILEAVSYVLAASETDPTFDYDDMIYLPNRFGWVLDSPLAMLVVDEGQDLSFGKRILLTRQPCYVRVFIGDSNQAIYAFAGADSDSMQNIQKSTNATQLPLSVTFRCARKIVDYARQFIQVGTIEPRKDAPAGEVNATIDTSPLFSPEGGDLVVCRKNAPLISYAWKLIKARKPVYIVGGTLSKSLKSIIKKVRGERKDLLLSEFVPLLMAWVDKRCNQMQAWQRNTDDAREQLQDQRDTLVLLSRECPGDGVKHLEDMIDDIFSAAKRPSSVILASIHRAKGLESSTVWWLHPENCPSKMARTPKALYQERNLQFVAATRAKNRLVLVASSKQEDVESELEDT
jgi:superfamily I DNA/RNA helicase